MVLMYKVPQMLMGCVICVFFLAQGSVAASCRCSFVLSCAI